MQAEVTDGLQERDDLLQLNLTHANIKSKLPII